MEDLRGEEFLDKLYKGLHMSDEVIHIADNKDSKFQKIHRYMDRLERINKKASKRENDINTLKHLYHKKYVIKKENLPEYMSDDDKEDIIRKQEDTIDKWLDYLLDTNAPYPTWAKYWVFQGMLKIGTYDEANDVYQKRSKKTIAPFIEADPEIIAKCIDVVSGYVDKKKVDDSDLEKLVASGNFSKLYPLFIKSKKDRVLRTDNIDDGIWITYHYETEEDIEEKEKKGVMPEYIKLYNSLQGYNTHWCTAGSKETAKMQICGDNYGYIGGDFHVYYTKDEDGEYKIPRIAIRMDRYDIGEIRGIADESQNVEDGFEEIIEQKIKTFKDITKENLEENMKIISDMKKLTELNQKNKRKEAFTEEEVKFLYGLDREIIGFGWDEDERIQKIISSRNNEEDYHLLKEDKDKIQFLYELSYYVDDEIIGEKDKNIILAAVKQRGVALNFADKSLRKDKEIVFAAVNENSFAIAYADDSLKKDKDIVLLVVSKDGMYLEHIDESLKKDKDIVLTAVKQNKKALKYVDDIFRKDKNFILELVQHGYRDIIWDADDSLRKDKAFILTLINKYNLGTLLKEYADNSFKKDKEVVLAAIKNDATDTVFFWIDESLKKDKEVALEAVKKDGGLLYHLDKGLKKDKEVVLAAVKQDPYSLNYADESLKSDIELIQVADMVADMQNFDIDREFFGWGL